MNIEKDLVFYDLEFENRNQFIDYIANYLVDKAYVKDEYAEKIKEREEQYPTGLKLKNVNISISHTDPEYSLSDKVYIAKLKKPVLFKNAEDFQDLEVSLIIGLLFQNGRDHLEVLKKIAQLLLNEEVIHSIMASQDKESLWKNINYYFDK